MGKKQRFLWKIGIFFGSNPPTQDAIVTNEGLGFGIPDPKSGMIAEKVTGILGGG